MKTQAVLTFSEALGVNPRPWKFNLKHYAEEPDLFGPLVFSGDQCRAPFSFLHEHLDHNLLITGFIYIEDDQSAMIGTLTCSSSQQKSLARTRLLLAGINLNTLEAASDNVKISRDVPYLDYIKAPTRQQRREAIFELSELAWGIDIPKFLGHPKLAPELQKLGIWDLREAEPLPEVGPVEFNGGRCTVPLTYFLYRDGELSKYDERSLGYYVEIHILGAIGNKLSEGGDISIQNMWFRIDSIDDPQDDAIPLVVP